MSSPVTDILDPPQDPSPALQFGTFFVYCLVVVVVMLFFFFYFNRAIASLLSRFLGYWCWHRHKAHVEVESIKIALLGGRISFRNLRYVAENQSISVLQGHITFRYWKWAVRDESDVSDPTPLTDANASPSLGPPPNPTMCRIGVRVKGIEWCMYNRTPVFDWIEDQYKAGLAAAANNNNRPFSRNSTASSSDSVHSSSLDPLNPTAGSQPSRPSSGPQQQQGQQPLQQQQQQQQPSGSSWFRDLFPIEFIAGKGCISIGNPSLPTVLILDWRKANGCYSIVPSRSVLDQYKSLLQIAFHRGQMQFRANVDYVPPTTTTTTTPSSPPTTTHEYKFPSARKPRTNPLRTFARSVRSLLTLPWRRRRHHQHGATSGSPSPAAPAASAGASEWMGLNRYRAAANTPNDDPGGGGGGSASAPPSGVSQVGTDGHVRTPPHPSTATAANASSAGAREQAAADSLGDEYAQVHKVVEFVALGLTYYADTVGLADPSLGSRRQSPTSGSARSASPHNIGNGDLDPEWGIDLVFYGALVNYGPWADRQRAAMQRFFFPFIYRNAETSPMLNPGEWRVHPSLRVYLRFVGRTVWRVPVREPSKHVKLGTQGAGAGAGVGAEGVARGETPRHTTAAAAAATADQQQPRAYGWLDIGFAGGSATIHVPMLTQRTLGSTTSAHVQLDAVTLASSVNYVDLLASRSVTVNVAMPSPQVWNAPRTWDVGVALDAPVVHLLRDHITLIQDLVADWGAVDVRIPRPPGHPLGVFVPFTYRVKVSVKDIELRLCVNELNVIDVPNDLAENNYYIIHAHSLAATVTIPLTRFQPTTTPISFSITLSDAHAHFSFSPSSTLGAFTSADARDSLRLARTCISGTYTYHAIASPLVPDLLQLTIDAHSGTLAAYGYLARYLILLVDNYVGLTPEYMTLDEFKLAGGRPAPLPTLSAPLDTCVAVTLADIRVVLPEAMYVLAPGTLSEMHTERAHLDVRITPVLMDLQLDIWPVEWTRHSTCAGMDDKLIVAGFSLHGHRMFGQPPVNPEYAAAWQVHVDRVEGSVSVPGLLGIGRWARAFDAQMDDFDNRIAHVGDVVASVMKVGLSVGQVDVVVRGEPTGPQGSLRSGERASAGEAHVHVMIGGFCFEYADLALADARTDVELDSIVLVHVLASSTGHTSSSVLGGGGGSATTSQPDDAVEIASVRAADIAVHLRARPNDDDPVHQTRVGHIQVHDAMTGRLAHLFGHPSVAADAGCGWFAPPFAVEEAVDGASPTQPFFGASGGAQQNKAAAAAAAAGGQAGSGSAADHYFKSLHSEGDLLQVPGLTVPGMHPTRSSPLAVDPDVANVDGVDRGLLSTPSSDSSTSLRSFATAPDYDQPRGRASTHASSTHGKFSGLVAGGSSARVRIAVPAVDSSTASLAYRHYLRTYHTTGPAAATTDEDEEEDESEDGSAVHALFALLQSSLQSGGKLLYVECLGSLDVVLTPASLAHAPSLIVDTPTCDLLLDALYLDYLKSSMRKPPPTTPPPPAMIGAVLRKVTVTLVQDCASSDLAKSVINIAELDAALGVNAIQLHVHGFDACSTLLPINPIAALSGPSDADKVFSASLEHGVFHGSAKIGGTWTGIEVNVAKPDLIPGMLSQWHVPDLSLPSHAQAFLSLAAAIPAPIVRDPSFLAQPSNLWRLGVRPHQHNPTWRLLCLFRAHLQSPLARSQLELELASNGMQPFPEPRLSALLQTWKFTPATRPGMPPVSPFAFLWAPPEDSEIDALIDVAVNKARSNVQLDLTKAKVMVEDSWVTLSGIHIASRAGEQVFVHTERVGVTVKPGMLAQVKRYIDDPASLFVSTVANSSSVSPKTTTSAAAPPSTLFSKPMSTTPTAGAVAASSSKPSDQHFVASIARVDVDVLTPKLSLHLKLRGAMASAVICTHTVAPVGLQASSSSTAQTAREPHTSVSWAVDSGDATLVGTNPLAVISVKDCSGVSGNKHLARVETIVVDLPQNILQLYTFIDEWKSYLEPVISVGASSAATGTATTNNGKIAATGPIVNKDVHKKPFGGIDFYAPNVAVSLGALPSLTVISRISAALHFSSETAWMLDVSRNDLGFLYAGQASAVYVTLPTVRVESRGARINVVLGVLQGTVSSETLQPIETSLSLLSREINDVLELLLFVSPKLARSMQQQQQQQQPSASATQSAKPGLSAGKSPAAPQLKNGATATASGVRISCDGVSLSMVTTRGVLQVHSDLITGSKLGDTWSFDSSQLSLAFLSLNRTMLSQVRFALSMSSSATLLRLGLSRFEMMVQPKAMLQLVDLVAFIAGETAVRKKAKEAELNQLSTTTQKVMESLDVNAAGGSGTGAEQSTGASSSVGGAAAIIGKRDVHIALDSVSCHLLVDAHHSTELTLHSATLWRKSGEFDVIASDLRLAIDGSSIVFPGCHVLSNAGSWTCQVQPCQLTIQSHLLPSIVVIFDETTNALVSAQTLASSFLTSSMETVPSIAATSSGQVNDFANIPVQVDFLGGKGTIIDSSISIPSGQLRLKDGLLWVHVSSSHNVLLPSAVELFRSLMDAPQSTRARTETSSTLGGLLSPMPLSPMPATPRSETMPDMHSTSANGGGGGGGASLPFQVLFVLEPTTIDLKGRKSKCLAQLQFSSTVHVDPAPLHVSVLVPTLSFGIHHPFASEDCVTMRINDITFAYGLDSGLLGQVPSVELKVLLRHFLEIREWIDEWTAHAPLSSMTTTAPPESPSASRNSRQFLTEPLPSPLGTSMRSSMQFDSAPFDFPHSLIKFGKVEATIQMGQAIGLATVTLPDLFMFAEHRTAHFSSNLAVAVNGRVLSRLDMRSFHATLQFQGHQTMVEAGIERILGTFQYQTAMTTVADVATVGILLVARGLSADLDIRVGDSVLLTSARAAPAVLNVMQRFKDLVGLSASPSTTPAAPLLSPFGGLNAVDPRFSGHITLLVSLISLHVYGESLMDPEHIMATVHRPLVHVTVNGGDPVHRVLKTHVDKIKLIKVTLSDPLLVVPPTDVAGWVQWARGPVSATPTTSAAASSAAALSGAMANSQPQSQPQQAPVPIPHRQTKLIAQVPKSDLSMTTWTVSDAASAVNNSISSSTSSTALLGQTNPGQVVVRHVFTTQFDGMIDLALNMILYRNLQDVIELYESEISRTMRTLQIIAGPSQEEKAIKFVLEPVEPPVLVPRLRVMGEATPPLEWLVKKELVPELAHTTVTLPLDGFLRSLASSFS